MKYPTLQKVMLTMTLVASLAFSAQAGQPAASAKDSQKSGDARSGQPQKTSGTAGAHQIHVPAAPHFPLVILYDQYDNAGANATSSQDFEASFAPFNDFAADDFVVPGDQSWSVETVDADGVYFNGSGPSASFNVFFYNDAGGLPGALVTSRTGMSYAQVGSTFTVTVSPAVDLTGGTYWVSVQARMDFTPGGQWGWTDRTTQSNSAAAWQNPGGGFGVCTSWGTRNSTCGIDPGVPDQVFRLNGTSMGGTPTPTPSPTPTPTPTPMGDALWYNGDFNDVNGLANERDTSLGAGQYASVYDDFNVNDADGWDVTSVFSNNLSSTNVTAATWEIRQGVSAGNPGTLIASGMTVTPNVSLTGRSGFGFIEYMVEVEGLSVHLDAGSYHLNVTPTGDLTGRSFDSTTSGANCVGTPCGNNQNAFFDSNFFGAFFASTADFGQPYDFSMGVNGTVSGGGGCDITLSAKLRRQMGRILVALNYTGTDGSGTVDVLRDGVVIHTSTDNGRAQDRPGAVSHVEYTYQVCETDTGCCSNEVTVRIP